MSQGFPETVDAAAHWLSRQLLRGAAVGAGAGAALWWAVSGATAWAAGRLGAGGIVLLVLCLAPAAWLLNVRAAVREVVALPGLLAGAPRGATRRVIDVGGPVDAVRAVRGFALDHRNITGASARALQLLSPAFWGVTVVSVVAVAGLMALAPFALLVRLLFL